MSDDVVISLKAEGRKDHPRKGEFYVCLPSDFYGMQGTPGLRVYLKTHDRSAAQERLVALATVARLTNASIKEF